MGSSKPEKEKNSKKSGSGSESGSGDEGEAPNASAAPGGLLSRFTQRFTSRNKPESKAAEPVVDYLEEEPEMYVDRDGADSDTNAEAATLFARRPLSLEGGVERSAQHGLLMALPCADTAHHAPHQPPSPRGTRERAGVRAPCATAAPARPLTPPATLSYRLDHVAGFACTTRHSFLYSAAGRLVYPAGGAAVVYDPDSHHQAVLLRPTQGACDVTCVALHPGGDLLAVGTAGHVPSVTIWSLAACAPRTVLPDFHLRALTCLAFDSAGELLATVGLDDAFTLAVYDWASGRMVATSPGAHRAFVCGFSLADQALVVGGVEHLTFWAVQGANMSPSEADYGGWRPPSPGAADITVTALGFHPDGGALTGSATGGLYRWRAGTARCLWGNGHAHRGAVHDITFTGDVIASGGADGRVVLWSPEDMRRVHVIDMRDVAGAQVDSCGRPLAGPLGRPPCIRSLCVDASATRLLVAASSGHAWEVDIAQAGTWRHPAGCQLLLSGHGAGIRQQGTTLPPPPRACALASHPCELACATVGDDGTLCVWDCSARAIRLRRPLPAPGCSVAFSPDDGALLAVGMVDGRMLVLDARSGGAVASGHHRSGPLCVLAFSPCGRWLLSGCDDGGVDMYDVRLGCVRVGSSPFAGPYGAEEEGSPVEHGDWSADSRYVRINTAHGALLFFEAPGCEPVRFAAALRDTGWATHTCPLSWATQGLWPADATPADVPACALSHGRDVIAAVTANGHVRLFRFPCDVGRASCTEAYGHGHCPAAACAWTFNDQFLLTYSGGGDRCLMQWTHVTPGRVRGAPQELLTSDVEEDALLPQRTSLLATCLTSGPGAPARVEGYVGGVPRMAPLHWLPHRSEGMASRPQPSASTPGLDPGSGAAFTPAWADMHVPDGYSRELDCMQPPPEALRLSFSFGHTAGGARHNVHACANSRGLIAHAGRLAYVYERDAHVMHFCGDDPASEAAGEGRARGHADAILCCAAHPSAALFATAEAGEAPRILVWSSLAPGEGPVARMPRGVASRGVSALTFSRDGTLLAVADCTRGSSRVALFRWAQAQLLGVVPSGCERVLALCWSPFQDYFVTAGLRHCGFWAPQPLRCKPADFSASAAMAAAVSGAGSVPGVAPDMAQSCLCIAFSAADMTAVGTQDGSLVLFRGATLAAVARRAHSVTHALLARRDALLSAGKEGSLKFWAPDLSACLRTLELSHPLAYGSCIKSLASVTGAPAVLAATRSGEVYSIDVATGAALLLLQGHGPGGVSALCAHPQLARFASCGGDGTLRLWDALARRPLLSRTMALLPAPRPGLPRRPLPLRCCAWHPSGTHLAVGASDGALFLVTSLSLDLVHSSCDRPTVALTAACFSPCGTYLVTGDADGVLTCYDIAAAVAPSGTGSEVARVSQVRGHVCSITAMDWSHDSVLLQTNAADDSLCFWDMPGLVRCASAADARNADWVTHRCPVTWATQGILPTLGGAVPPVTCCSRTHARTCLAVGDAHGLVSMYQYPTHAGARRRLFGGHAGPVTAVQFLVDDTHLVSASQDGSLLLWSVVL